MPRLSNGTTRRALAAGAAVGLLITTSGCLRLDLELQIRPDDTVGGTFTAAWSEEFLEEARSGEDPIEQSELDAFLEALLEGVPDAERSSYSAEGYVGQTASFTDRPLSEFADLGGDEWGYLRITHEDRRYVLDGYWDLRANGFLEPEDLERAEILIRVDFPAKVTAHNGELEGRAVTWTMTPGRQYELHAEAEQYNGLAWLAIGVGSLAVVLGLLWLWQWTRLRKFSR
ncbi:LppM family (lipo)protein [Glycomyces tarimensis]